MAKQQDTLSEIGLELCNNLGFNPTSNSTKPLYVANGLFRSCTGIECRIDDIHEWVLSERRSKAVSSEEMLEKYQDTIYESGEELAEDLKEIRFYMEKVFNPDSTVFPSVAHSVMNIPSKWLVRSKVPAEADIGEFLRDILYTPIAGKVSPAIAVIESALMNDDDDLTRLVKPLIVRKPEDERIKRNKPEYTDVSWNAAKQTIRSGFDCLARNCDEYSKQKGSNSLLVLRRMVSFSMFAVFYYLEKINRVSFGGKRIPLLLDSGQSLGAIERASEACFVACKKAVEAYTTAFACEWLKNSGVIRDYNSQNAYEEYIAEGFSLTQQQEAKGVRSTILQHIRANCQAGDPPLLATAKALQFALYTYKYPNTTPSDFCNVLGTKAGFVSSGSRYKRFLINRFLLETIVLSVINTDSLIDGIELCELGTALRDSYCIVIGTDTDIDYALMDNYGIAGATPEDLRGELSENAKEIANMLISMGLAKRYADGVTLIGWEV